MITKTPAIVIHTLRYGEADVIAKIFTRTSGLKSYLLRGILKSKKGKIRSSLFQPLAIIEIEALHRDKGTLEHIKDAKISIPYSTLHTNVIKNSLVFFLSEILKNSIKEEETNTELFDFLEASFIWLDTHNDCSNFHIVFLIKFTQYLGFCPDTSNIEEYDHFNLLEGYFENSATNIYSRSGIVITMLKKFLGTTFDGSRKIRVSKKLRSDIVDVLLVYFELHLHEFKKPKSLAVLNEIFD